MLFRRKKKSAGKATMHPTYSGARLSDDAGIDDVNRRQANHSIIRIAIVCAVILVIMIATATTAFMTMQPSDTSGVQAADTYAISSATQQEIRDMSTEFATGMLLYAYCSDEDVAEQGRLAALSLVSPDVEAYDKIMSTPYNGGVLPSDSIRIFTSDASMVDGTQSYAGSYSYVMTAGAVDTSKADDDNPDGVPVDDGVSLRLTFELARNENTGEQRYVITSFRFE